MSDVPITIEEARAAYVQRRAEWFAERFARFDAAGGFQFTLCWPVFFMGVLWFLYRKMYVEALAIFVLTTVVGGAFEVVTPGGSLAFAACLAVVLSLSANWFYWKAVDRHVERAWDMHPQRPREALEWLAGRGGVNVWLPLAAMALSLLSLLKTIY